MQEFVLSLISIFVLILIPAISKWHELYQLKKYQQLVSFAAVGNIGDLDIAVWNAQFKASVNKKYQLTIDETEYIREIIEAFRTDIMQAYFKEKIPIIKSKYAIDDAPYFLYCLYIYLRKHQDNLIFLGHEMRKPNGFSLTYRKLHYITFQYCINSKIFRDYIGIWEGNGLSDYIDAHIESEDGRRHA